MVIVECDGCGEDVEKKPCHVEKYDRHYCSRSCRSNKVKVTCSACGNEFEKRKSMAEKVDNHYCDMSCRNKGYEKRVEFECDYCGDESEYVKSKYERHDNHFCSRECSQKFHTVEHNTECTYCGKKIYVNPYRFERSENIFCSNQCKGDYNKENDLLKKENHPMWNGGYSTIKELRYSSVYQRWANKILERDDYTCQGCGQVGGKLQVHHIKPVSDFPDLLMDEDNVESLCLKCHQEKHPDVPMIYNGSELKQSELTNFLERI